MPEYPESGDYVVGRYEVSARVDEFSERSVTPGYLRSYEPGPTKRTPVVIVSSLKAAHAFLTATPADARGIASALSVAAGQADTDAGVTIVQDSTPEWLKVLVAMRGEMAPPVTQVLKTEITRLRAELAELEAEGYRQIAKLQAENTRLAAELDTVTTERDNALAELESPAYREAMERKQSMASAAELDAMRAELAGAAKLAECTCEYPYEVTGLGHHPGCELGRY